jgi:hypothetical protein
MSSAQLESLAQLARAIGSDLVHLVQLFIAADPDPQAAHTRRNLTRLTKKLKTQLDDAMLLVLLYLPIPDQMIPRLSPLTTTTTTTIHSQATVNQLSSFSGDKSWFVAWNHSFFLALHRFDQAAKRLG